MLVFQTQPAPLFKYDYVSGPFSLTPQFLASTLHNLTPQIYLEKLQPFLDALQNSTLEKRAEFCDILLSFNASFMPVGPIASTQLQRAFLYELASAVAPAWAAREGANDFAAIKTEADKTKFREKYGYYSPKSRRYEIHHNTYSNCRQYVLRKYYAALGKFLSPEATERLGPDSFTVRKLTFSGRPKYFDYQATIRDAPVKCFSPSAWARKSAAEKEFYLTGDGVAYVAYTFSARDTKRILNFLQAGDLVSADVSIHTGNGHVGIYDGNGHIVNTGSPLYSEPLKTFARKSKVITVRRLVVRRPAFLSLAPILEEPNPWTLPIMPTGAAISDLAANKAR